MSKDNNSISSLIKLRDDAFVENTKLIIGVMDDTINGVREYLISADPSYALGNFIWEDVTMFEDIVIVIGVVTYDAGTELLIDGELETVTDNTSDYFTRLLRVGVPLRIAEECDTAATVQFLTDLNRTVDDDSWLTEQLGLDEDEINSVVALPEEKENISETNNSTNNNTTTFEFDKTELSAEQQAALDLYEKMKR